MGSGGDYSTFYGTAAQVIPFFVLIFVVEARAFSDRIIRKLRVHVYFYVYLVLTFVGESAAFLGLMFPPRTEFSLTLINLLVTGGVFAGASMAAFAVLFMVKEQLDSSRPPVPQPTIAEEDPGQPNGSAPV